MKEWIIGIILVVLFAYYLGITIASVVDYRLKDAIINLPEQKNTIYLNVKDVEGDKEIIEKFVNDNTDEKTTVKVVNKKKRFENFENMNKESKEDTIIDQNQKAYAMSYKVAKKLAETPFPFKASNSYDYDQVYSTFEK
jgi:hypothetical protein